jgi:hypothetical protein
VLIQKEKLKKKVVKNKLQSKNRVNFKNKASRKRKGKSSNKERFSKLTPKQKEELALYFNDNIPANEK